MERAVPLALVVLVLLAGCAEQGEPSTSLELESSGVPCQDDLRVSFWGLDSGQWEGDTVRVGYPAPANTSFLLVAYVDDSPEGVLYENTSQNESAHVDGAEISLDSNFSGTHTVQVVLYKDENRNEQFDQETDSPCLKDGEVIRAGPERVGF